ncbi:outer membrane protein [Owenweeksia hongkongensis DSM 17368]|uniref:Outer membrane protein n=1 Tax=Owenweeksia hongkongensis (strain DSM 17368 / CIP 108786 / JCM 12287 / NRRL B-23963 / UST20020801) TaxID=926562 RepID=G8QZ89_OWEHD|nr:TolC family protein [Owenweeksia hongkongensis]AEV31472.1 outer membrane protein [Owenweeksia hongkongensis DSM 17368]
MRKTVISALMALIVSIPFAVKGQTDNSFTLKQSLDYALKNSIDIQKSILDKKQADHLVSEVRGTGLPQVNANGQFQNFPNLPTQLLPGEIVGQPGTQIPVQFGTKFNATGTIEASQLLYNQQFFTGLQAANASEQLYELLKIQTEEDVIYQVSTAYYQVLEIQASINALQANVDRLNEVEKIMKVQQENDLITKTDYNRLKVNRINIETNLQTLKTAEEQSKNYLKLLMGMSMEQNISLIKGEDIEEINLSTLQYEKEIPIEIQLLDKQYELNVLNKKSLQAGNYPSLAAFGQQSWNAQRNEFNFFDDSQSWFQQTVIGVQLNVPLFSGLQRHHQVQQAKIDIEKTQLDLLYAERGKSMEYQNAREQLLNSMKSVEAQRENKDLAQEVYDQTQELYAEQVGSLTDLLDAETSWRESQINYIREILKFKKAELDLLRAQGQLRQLSNS